MLCYYVCINVFKNYTTDCMPNMHKNKYSYKNTQKVKIDVGLYLGLNRFSALSMSEYVVGRLVRDRKLRVCLQQPQSLCQLSVSIFSWSHGCMCLEVKGQASLH